MITNLKLAGLLIVLLAALPLAAQVTPWDTDTLTLQHRCTTVALTADTPLLPFRLIAPYFERRADFQASKLVLVEDPRSADALVHLTGSTGVNTRIVVTNRMNGQTSSTSSDWTNYPGMVALDAIEQLKLVCPGSVIEAPRKPEVSRCSMPELVYQPVHTLAACSHTSWMDNRDLYDALRSDAAVKQLSLELRPACSSADVALEVSHNLDVTVEWYWKLKSRQGETLSAGRVIAYEGKEAGARIVGDVARELALVRGNDTSDGNRDLNSQSRRTIQTRNLSVKLLPSDFSVRDTSLQLHIDSEEVRARDAHGNLVFAFAMQDFRDARLTRGWDQPMQFDYPAPLVASAEYAGNHWFDPVVVRNEEMPFNHGAIFLAEATALAAYSGIDVVLSQVRTPWHSLDLAWESNGQVKTVSLQVSGHDGKQLVRDLRMASVSARPACAVTNADVR